MDHDNERGEVSEDTRRAEAKEAHRAHDPDRPVTPEEEAALAEGEVDEEVRRHYKEMAERGANQKGEGRIP